MADNIHPVFDRMLERKYREIFLNQRALVIWLVGLSGSGKSTIGIALERLLFSKGFFVQMLDGDNIRSGINGDLGFSDEDRRENIRRIAEIARLYAQSGVITINSFISPTRTIRQMTKNIIGPDYFEVFVDTPLEVCEQRDVKGLYAKARKGEIRGFTGIDAPFESPENPELILKTENKSVEACTKELFDHIIEKINP